MIKYLFNHYTISTAMVVVSWNIVDIYKHLKPFAKKYYDMIKYYTYKKHKILDCNIVELDPNIFVIENVITADECKEYIKIIDETQLVKDEISTEAKNNVECFRMDLSDFSKNDIKYQEVDKKIFKTVNKCFFIAKKLTPTIEITRDCGYSFRKVWGRTKQHIDYVFSDTSESRTLSMILLLNDDYHGGIFLFPNQKVEYRLKKGSAIIFPPYYTHPHSVSGVNPGEFRYTINTWGQYK